MFVIIIIIIDKSAQPLFDSEKTLIHFVCDPDGVRTSGHRMLSPTLYQLSYPVTNMTRSSGIVTG